MSEQPQTNDRPRNRGRPPRNNNQGGVLGTATVQRPVEPPEQKAARLANKRVNACLAKMRLIGNLGATHYGLTDELRAKIISGVYEGFLDMKRRVEHKPRAKENWSLY